MTSTMPISMGPIWGIEGGSFCVWGYRSEWADRAADSRRPGSAWWLLGASALGRGAIGRSGGGRARGRGGSSSSRRPSRRRSPRRAGPGGRSRDDPAAEVLRQCSKTPRGRCRPPRARSPPQTPLTSVSGMTDVPVRPVRRRRRERP